MSDSVEKFLVAFIAVPVATLIIMCEAILFYFLWNVLAPIYFSFLPEVYLQIPFWHCFGLIVLLTMLKWILLPGAGLSIGKGKG